MKIRKGFVTNSSSSSFVSVSIDNPMLASILQKYQEYFEDDCCIQLNITGEAIAIEIEEGYADVPSTLDDVLVSLLNALGVEIYDDDEISAYGGAELENLAREVLADKENITAATTCVEFTQSDCGWQGDSDSRYYKENYDEETLQDIMEEIAAQKGCKPEDVTDEDFNYYVSDKMSTSEDTYYYNKETGEETTSHSFYIE